MSVKTIEAIHDAIRAHVEDTVDEPGTLTDWVVGFCTASAPDWAEGEIAFRYDYTSNPSSSPAASLGLIELTHQSVHDDLTGGGDDD